MSENKKTIVINLVAVDKNHNCEGCYFDDTSRYCVNWLPKAKFPCDKFNRKDHRSIIWKEV